MIETERLIIKPLTYSQLLLYTRCDNSLESELDLQHSSRVISPELREALEQTIIPNVADNTRNYLYSTLWVGISKKDNAAVGDLCIIGEPDSEGSIEIGYGTYDEFQGKGYMTELVAGIIKWAFTQPLVKSVTASTNKDNAASQKVLIRNKFVKVDETETLIRWKLERGIPEGRGFFAGLKP